MKKCIIVSGTPGTGKTEFARKLAEKGGHDYLDVTEFIKKNSISDGIDKKRRCKIVDVEKLNKRLIEEIKCSKNKLVIDSHLSHNLSKKYVEKCYIIRCDISELKKRLEKRGYSIAKVRENVDSEIFDICLTEARENGHNVQVVDTSKKKGKN